MRMTTMTFSVLFVLLLGICCQAGVVKREPIHKKGLAMDFFEEFNNLFGYDWWGTEDSNDKELEPDKTLETGMMGGQEQLKPRGHHQPDDELAALLDDIIHHTDPTPPVKQVQDQYQPRAHVIHHKIKEVRYPDISSPPPPPHYQPSAASQSYAWQTDQNHPQANVIHHTDLPPAKEVRYQDSYPPPPQTQPPPSPHQPPSASSHPWQNLHPVPGNIPYQQPYYNYPHPTQGNHPVAGAVPYHPPYYPPPQAYYYPPHLTTGQASQEVSKVSQFKNEVDLKPEARSVIFDVKTDPVEISSSPPPSFASHPHFYLPPPPPPSYYAPPPYTYDPPRDFLDSSLDTFMSLPPVGPLQPQGQQGSFQDAPAARSYGDMEERGIGYMLAEFGGTLNVDELDDESANDDDLDQEAIADLDAGLPSPYFYPPHLNPDIPSHPSNNVLEDNLDGQAETFPSAPDHLDYLSLTSSDVITPQEPFNDLMEESFDNKEGNDDSFDDPIPELDDTTMCQTLRGLIGSCVSPTECSSVSGLPSGPCTVPSVSDDLTCCLHSAHCGQQSSNLVTYIHNHEYPAPTSTLPSCPISIALLPNICQVRMDFLHLSLSPPSEGSCNSSNSITLSTSPGGDIAQHSLCGSISGSYDPLSSNIPHLYTHYNLSTSPHPFPEHQLNFQISVSDYPSIWNIRVAQIRCEPRSSTLAPLMAMSTCSQWFTAPIGIMNSFNLLDKNNQFKACIKPDPIACAVKYVFYNVVCNMDDQVQIMGSNMTVCGVDMEREVVVPAGEVMGLIVNPGKAKEQDSGVSGVSSYTVGYTMLYDCTGLVM